MKCPKQSADGQELLVELGFGSLDGERAAALEAHARECRDCAALLAAQRSVSAMLERWEAPEVSADFDRRLYARIEQEVPWWDALVRPFRGASFARWIPVATAAGLLVAIGLWIERPMPVSPPVLPPEQAASALQDMQAMQEFSNLIQADTEPRI